MNAGGGPVVQVQGSGFMITRVSSEESALTASFATAKIAEAVKCLRQPNID
jgi:hypothetical protein